MLTIYKNGSMALSTIMDGRGPYRKCDAMLLSMAPSEGKAEGGRGSKINLEEAITISFKMVELCAIKRWITEALRGPIDRELGFMREYKGQSKRLTIKKGTTPGTFGFMLGVVEGETKNNRAIYVTADELYAVGYYIDRVIESIMNAEFMEWPEEQK